MNTNHLNLPLLKSRQRKQPSRLVRPPSQLERLSDWLRGICQRPTRHLGVHSHQDGSIELRHNRHTLHLSPADAVFLLNTLAFNRDLREKL